MWLSDWGKKQPLPVSDVAEPYVSVTDVKTFIVQACVF